MNKKDVTRPETSRQFNSFNLSSFEAIQQNGAKESLLPAANSRQEKVIIEYSLDGINFLPGQEVVAPGGIYKYRHALQDTRSILYRVRTEHAQGTISYSGAFLPKGMTISPVQIQNNIVRDNTINSVAQFPVERIIVLSGDGVQVFKKDINGQRDFIPIAIPSLKNGVYFMTFYGNGWKSTSRFIVG